MTDRLNRAVASARHELLPGPDYDPADVVTGIAHIGVGGFHRAHQAMYVDRMLAEDPTWGIVGIGLRPEDRSTLDELAAQDGTYSLTIVDPAQRETTRIIGSIVGTRHRDREGAALLVSTLADPAIRVVTLTITEGAYGIDPDSGEYVPRDEAAVADMAGSESPRSAMGLIVDALAARHRQGHSPFAVVSCDNIPHNGAVSKAAVLGMARVRVPEIVSWISAEVSFPSSMVDRITPAPTPAVREAVADAFGIEDACAVRSESFVQWVLEDAFPHGRPPLGSAGVMMVEDVVPYELMKLRLLNASHQVMSYPALLAGIEWVHDACSEPRVRSLMEQWMIAATGTLPSVPGVDLDQYREDLLERFSSPAVKDTLARQVAYSSDRIATFVRPALDEMAVADQQRVGALVLALWGHWVRAQLSDADDRWSDPRRDELQAAIVREQSDAAALLDVFDVVGEAGRNPEVRRVYCQIRADLDRIPALEVIDQALAATPASAAPQ
ncbi:mannitol dehydrogenase family protein [Demequina flava]|uniref:mannitol dehydrogenase family protein n=1 Tax=Demequina flava TaxID=1095025 RepID=UPI0007846994|nr:mannitol dehydrogenase family protein [Demequina flava]